MHPGLYFSVHTVIMGGELQHGKVGCLEVRGLEVICEDSIHTGSGGIKEE